MIVMRIVDIWAFLPSFDLLNLCRGLGAGERSLITLPLTADFVLPHGAQPGHGHPQFRHGRISRACGAPADTFPAYHAEHYFSFDYYLRHEIAHYINVANLSFLGLCPAAPDLLGALIGLGTTYMTLPGGSSCFRGS